MKEEGNRRRSMAQRTVVGALEGSADAEGNVRRPRPYSSAPRSPCSCMPPLRPRSKRKLKRTLLEGEEERKRYGCPGHKYWWSGVPWPRKLRETTKASSLNGCLLAWTSPVPLSPPPPPPPRAFPPSSLPYEHTPHCWLSIPPFCREPPTGHTITKFPEECDRAEFLRWSN